MSIEKYSNATNTWEQVTEMSDDRRSFSACSFMDSIYIVGGVGRDSTTNACVEFNTKTSKWKVISNMNEGRNSPACSVFEGRVVVSGGLGINGASNTVEVYDHVADMWLKYAGMVERRYSHKSVAVKNKLFSIGGSVSNTCEVFNSNINNFCLLKKPEKLFERSFYYPRQVIAIGTKLNFFCNKGNVIIYDIDNDKWSEKTCEATENLFLFSCVKLPVKTF